jgi:GH15 family glucan-1,4-alpha-glucosidase
MGVPSADDPRIRSTVAAIERHLDLGWLRVPLRDRERSDGLASPFVE